MKIEPLDKQTVKIVLSLQDMQQFSLTYESMDYEDPTTRRVILQLLRRVRETTKVDFGKGKLFIEAFPEENGGCILYLNLLASQKRQTLSKNGFNTPLVVRLEGMDDLIGLCRALIKGYSHLVLKSNLYADRSSYLLTVYSYYKQDARLCALLSEYGLLEGRGEIAGRMVSEHAELLVKEKAVEQIACRL